MTIMREPEYKEIFPNVHYPDRGYTGAKSNTNAVRESVNSEGCMFFVGVDGGFLVCGECHYRLGSTNSRPMVAMAGVAPMLVTRNR